MEAPSSINVLGQATSITGRLLNMLQLDQVYLYESPSAWELIILVPNANEQHIIECVPLINMTLTAYPRFSYRLFYTTEVKEGLKRGNLLFFAFCRMERLVYIRPDCKVRLFAKSCDCEKTYSRVKAMMEKENLRMDAFWQGTLFYLAQGNYPLAAFMLHQHFECIYRFAGQMAYGRAKTTHSLKNQHKDLCFYLPELRLVFNLKDPFDIKRVILLDEAYIATRYRHDYQISKQELDWLMDKSLELVGRVRDLAGQQLEDFRRQYAQASDHICL